MSNFFKSIFDNNYPVLIDQSIKDIKQHFLKIIEKKKKITTEDVLDYLKKNDFSLNSLDDKPKKNTDQFDFVFKDNLINSKMNLESLFNILSLLRSIEIIFLLDIKPHFKISGIPATNSLLGIKLIIFRDM